MANVQCDYSTLSTSMSQGEIGNLNFIYGLTENIREEEETSSECSGDVNGESVPPQLSPPNDRFNFVYLAFGLLGVGTLLPWNFFITAYDYWMYKFRNATNHSCVDPVGQRTSLQTSFTSYIALAINVPYVIFLIMCMILHGRIARLQYVVVSLLVMILTFICITVLVKVNTDDWQMIFFALTMFLVVLMGISSAILQAASAGVSSILPPKYIHIMVLGQALAGILASLIQIASLLGHCDPVESALGYFISADVILLITLIVYLGIHRTPFFQFYLHNSQDSRPMKDVSSVDVKFNIPVTSVMKKIWPYAICVLLAFWVTIGIFPGLAVLVTSEDVSNKSIWTGRLFLPVACFTLFNFGDFFGRTFGGFLNCDVHSQKYRLLIFSAVRIVFVPLFILCNAHPRSHLPVIFGDIAYIVFISALGFTNGCLVTMAMICGTKCVRIEMQDMAGIILSAFLGVGLMLGSLSSYILIQLL